jgi:hypothetical protein
MSVHSARWRTLAQTLMDTSALEREKAPGRSRPGWLVVPGPVRAAVLVLGLAELGSPRREGRDGAIVIPLRRAACEIPEVRLELFGPRRTAVAALERPIASAEHPIIRSAELAQGWSWCHIDEIKFVVEPR